MEIDSNEKLRQGLYTSTLKLALAEVEAYLAESETPPSSLVSGVTALLKLDSTKLDESNSSTDIGAHIAGLLNKADVPIRNKKYEEI